MEILARKIIKLLFLDSEMDLKVFLFKITPRASEYNHKFVKTNVRHIHIWQKYCFSQTSVIMKYLILIMPQVKGIFILQAHKQELWINVVHLEMEV